jgi:hypothetical protein
MIPTEDANLAAAVALGWRVAELYSLVDDGHDCSPDTLLPAHSGLARADQLELQLRAAAGDAKRAGVTSKPASLAALVDVARESAGDDDLGEVFREQLRACHVEINKDLWSISEALGKAYELGNGLSDTYGLVCRAYRDTQADRVEVWKRVFDEGRVERLKKLLDDLQSRLDATAVTVVREQLDTWRAEVLKRLEAKDVPTLADVRMGLRRQTVIWRQLVAGDKLPEAYLGDEERARVRDTLRALAWKRYRLWLPPLVLGLTVLIFLLPKAAEWYQESVVQSGFASAVVAAIGALGITRASLVLTARTRLQAWADLLWHRAVVSEVAQATLTVDQVFHRPPPREHRRIVNATARAAGRLRASVTPPKTASEGQAG